MTNRTTRSIPLTQGYVALVDAADFEMLSHFKWSAEVDGSTAYAVKARMCRRGGGNVFMHRMIMLPEPGQSIDHINGNGWDNRRANLRVCTHAENMRHRRRPSHNTSGFKGVSWDRQSRSWDARISARGEQRYLGHFKTAESAAAAYDAAARELHDDFARLNQDEGERTDV